MKRMNLTLQLSPNILTRKKNKPAKADISLKLDDLIKGTSKNVADEEDEDDDTLEYNETKKENQYYAIQPNMYENERMATNPDLKESDDKLREYLSKDPYLRVAYRLMLLQIK